MNRKYVVPKPGMVITEDTTFLPGVYYFFEDEGITIGASNISIDGNGAVFIGGKMKGKDKVSQNTDEFSYGYSMHGKDDSLGFHGIAVNSKNTENVTIKNLSAKNFEIGLKLENCTNYKIHNNDFSYNYHNPDHGWDEHEDLGGIVLLSTHHCVVENNKANNVWNGLTIRNGDKNFVENNDFSHTSNVGLRLWHGCENEFYRNDFSWGIRKEPYEVHARDSSCVLIETGSNNNKFIKNDMRFGGDGLFIRSLNGWMSTGNYFEENDTSFANNNAIEAWDEGNTYVRNKANFSSYGFWLGNSDNTVLIENEVSYNGVNFNNAPENFGNAGISVVNGSGTNFKLIRNKIHHNNGPGIAIRNRVDYPAVNWVLEHNEIYENKSDNRGYAGHGIYLKYAKNITLINNKIYGNDGESLYIDEYVGDVKELHRRKDPKEIKVSIRSNSKTFIVNKEFVFKSEIEKELKGLNYVWDFGDGESYDGEIVSRKFEQPGFYRVILSVNDGENVGFDCINIYVLSEGLEIFNEENISNWSMESDGDVRLTYNDRDFVSGKGSLMLQSSGVKDITLRYPRSENLGIDASDYSHFGFCIRYLNEMIDWYKENKTPTIRFCKDLYNYIEFTPKSNLFGDLANKYNESKYNWTYLEIDLINNDEFLKKVTGNFDFREISYMEINIDNQISAQSIFMISGMRFILKEKKDFFNIVDVSKFLDDCNSNKIVEVSSNGNGSDTLAPLMNVTHFGDLTKRWISSNDNGIEYYQINFDSVRTFNRVVIDFYHCSQNTLNCHQEKLPKGLILSYFSNGKWLEINEGNIKVLNSHNVITFEAVMGSKLRLILEGENKPFSIYNIEVNNMKNKLNKYNIEDIKRKSTSFINIEKIGVKLNYSLHEGDKGLSDLKVSLNEYDKDILDSKEIASKDIQWEEINFGKETTLDIAVDGLDNSKNYYLAMTQKKMADDLTKGQYYRWSGKGISDMDGSYGYINKDGIVNDKVGWGRNWMKIYTDKYVLDLSDNSDTLGNRFGLSSMEKIYQKFILPDPIIHIVEGSISSLNSLTIKEEEVIKVTLKELCSVNKVILYFIDPTPRNVIVKIEEKSFEGRNCEDITEVTLNKRISELTIFLKGDTILKSIELL
ncbi:right-handed parallel beta-helix repeat-containing protein [Neobacillus sp. PS3-34]|uniref:right-handed parallel beta-helix repeat-containing protein n=1 Tax=Neobacillus sp. PS3-34 TaxID=3070678 RepID=UPI0027E10D06|nr:right-handed parallel beta-helix repeat-containing protein [Neobacillus sp. PS3-34]WML48307.1 right-handed parallel beta-helix repeat-containing protein [Neobacillus sp. PS3-34]